MISTPEQNLDITVQLYYLKPMSDRQDNNNNEDILTGSLCHIWFSEYIGVGYYKKDPRKEKLPETLSVIISEKIE